MNRLAITTVLFVSISSLLGCTTLEVPYEPPGHAGSWDPVFGSCHACGTCGGTCEGHTPASYIGHQLRCTSGCGEIYWGPWLSDPPDQCDPCDDCGDWVGDRCCKPKLRQRLWWAMTGQHDLHASGKGCGTCGGKACSSCGRPGCNSCNGALAEEPYYEPDGSDVAPHEAPEPEMLPETPPSNASERETPTTIRPAQGVSFALPFRIRSTRLAP